MDGTSRRSADAVATTPKASQWQGEMFDGLRSTYGSDPPALLRATADELFLSGSLGEYHLPRDRVWKVGRGDFHPWLCTSIQIHHGITEYPNQIQFKPSQDTAHGILARLQELGYPAA